MCICAARLCARPELRPADVTPIFPYSHYSHIRFRPSAPPPPQFRPSRSGLRPAAVAADPQVIHPPGPFFHLPSTRRPMASLRSEIMVQVRGWTEKSDKDLVAALLENGDEDAFRELYKRYTPRLYRTVLSVLDGQEHEA